MRLVISKKLWWIWGGRFENNLSFLKMAPPPPPPHSKWTISPQTAQIDPQNPSSLKFVWRVVCEGARKDIHSGNWLYSLPDLQLVKSNVKSWKKRIGVRGAWRVGVLSTFFRAIDIEHYLTKTRQLQSWFVHISLLYFWWFRRQLLYVMWNHLISRSTMCFIVPPLQSQLNHSTLHWTICVWLKPFVSRLHRSTLHWTICVWLEPLVNVWVTSYFTQTITQQSRWPFVIKLDHFAPGILVDYNLNKPILVWRYRFNIYQWTAPRLTKSFVV